MERFATFNLHNPSCLLDQVILSQLRGVFSIFEKKGLNILLSKTGPTICSVCSLQGLSQSSKTDSISKKDPLPFTPKIHTDDLLFRLLPT